MPLALIALEYLVSVSKKQFLEISDALMEDEYSGLCVYLIQENKNQIYNGKNAV